MRVLSYIAKFLLMSIFWYASLMMLNMGLEIGGTVRWFYYSTAGILFIIGSLLWLRK